MTRIFASADVEKLSAAVAAQECSDSRLSSLVAREVAGAVGREAGASGKTAQQLYDALPVSDQAQMREFYLTTLEAVDAGLREKFNKLYRYY